MEKAQNTASAADEGGKAASDETQEEKNERPVRNTRSRGSRRPRNTAPKREEDADPSENEKTQEERKPRTTRASRSAAARTEKAERPARGERAARGEKAEKPAKPERAARTEKPARAERPVKSEKPVRVSKAKNVLADTSSKPKVRIIPLGGLEQIGMNITAFEYEDTIVVVDCGLAFPTDDMLGIDLVIPDVTYLERNIDKVKGFVITHGHEDHIGALPYILQKINVPVYGTKLTIALIENKLKEHNLMKSTKRKVVKHGQSVNLGCFRVEFIKTNHSIADSAALALFTPAGIIVHTGDFKVDYTPVFGDAFDLARFAELGRKGVLALLSDSTNAIRKGFTASERTVGKTFDAIFAEHKNNRIIVATFASNVDRVQQIIFTAEKYGRKVVVEGRSMVNVIGTANELGYINISDGTLIEIDQLKNYPDEQTVLITTGSQGESMAALSRMASGMHRKVSIKPNDVVIMSSTPIPGNEKQVAKVINELAMRGVEVITEDTHVSGHACQEEIKLIYSLLHPKFALPVHGEYRHLVANRSIATAIGVPKENVLIMSSGDVVEICEDSCKVVDHVQHGGILVDGLGVGDVGNIVLRDRQNLAQNGIIIVVLTLERYSNQLLAGPDIVSRGFVYVRESEDLMDEAKRVVDDAVADCLSRHVTDWGKLKNMIRDSLSDFMWKRMKRNPMILPIIMEVE
ncbi:ribonuclease J [Clostridium sp. AF27-2AA]|nr:ribonuclease J [Clostridium sp. AF27-2AA]